MSIQSSTLIPLLAAVAGSSVTTLCPRRWRRNAVTIGPISREGSSTTTEPVQVSRVGMPMEVVLKPPEPARTRAWVDPMRQGSMSRGSLPPRAQLRRACGSKRVPTGAVMIPKENGHLGAGLAPRRITGRGHRRPRLYRPAVVAIRRHDRAGSDPVAHRQSRRTAHRVEGYKGDHRFRRLLDRFPRYRPLKVASGSQTEPVGRTGWVSHHILTSNRDPGTAYSRYKLDPPESGLQGHPATAEFLLYRA